MICYTEHYDTRYQKWIYGFKVCGIRQTEYHYFGEFGKAKKYVDTHPNEVYYIFNKGNLSNIFTPNENVIDLALDTSENFDLHLFMGHLYKQISFYIKEELDAIEELASYREEYIATKKTLGEKFFIKNTGRLTNAQLVRQGLNLKRVGKTPFAYIPPFPMDETDPLIRHFEELGDNNENYTCTIGGCECVFSRGGVHASLTNFSFSYFSLLNRNTYLNNSSSIFYYDITSYYPSLIKCFKYINNGTFDAIYNEHIVNKTSATKLFLNTVSGVLEECDSNKATNMRITGQILIYLALRDIESECKSFKLLNLNTDGFICQIDNKEREKLELKLKNAKISQISKIKCQKITSIFIKDINNYVAFFDNGTEKIVGNLKQGIDNKGRFSINNNAVIIKDAVINRMRTGQSEEEYITYNQTDYNKFQFIANAGNMFVALEHNSIRYPKIMRVYATTDAKNGTLYKVNPKNEKIKVPNIPDYCDTSTDFLDVGYYINQAVKLSNEYGLVPQEEKEEIKPMAEKVLNVYQKLNKARTRFLKEEDVKKSGFNTYQGFHYFTLEDIIPTIQKIFDDIGLIGLTTVGKEEATLTIVNTDNPMETILFTSPMIAIRQDKANRTTNNDMQDLGGIETYQRRYLYLMALDIIEQDTIDAVDNTIRNTERIVKDSVQKANFTPNANKREQATLNLTDTKQLADEIQVKGLERVIDKAKTINDPKLIQVINKLYAETNHLKNITRERCESAILWFSNQIEENGNGVAKE